MQLMAETARLHSVSNVYDPGTKISLQESANLSCFPIVIRVTCSFALAAYNAGIKAVKTYGGVPPFPIREYIRRVLEYHQCRLKSGT